jgi:hypothetical protein
MGLAVGRVGLKERGNYQQIYLREQGLEKMNSRCCWSRACSGLLVTGRWTATSLRISALAMGPSFKTSVETYVLVGVGLAVGCGALGSSLHL